MNRDRGTAAIEFAFAIMVLLLLAIGAYEWGTGFSDRISMSSAVREGGRVGSAAGDNPDADCRIIEASAGALNGVSGNSVKQLWVYESDSGGTVGLNRQIYRPAQAAEPGLTCTGGRWFLVANGWPYSVRENLSANRDWLGVKVIVDHEWRTGFLWWNGTVEWEEDAVFHLEPGVVS
ncbi:MAG TPA: TadE family protein [Acidimicrobiia bacterium]|nr:TadE family protein [Acidimicrobiia bacterium]HLF61696.1 TadE family protein [Acidimicrobiia bacterium]